MSNKQHLKASSIGFINIKKKKEQWKELWVKVRKNIYKNTITLMTWLSK